MADYNDFLKLSAILTGFDTASLWGTGCVELYERQFAAVAGPDYTAVLYKGAAELDTIQREARDLGTTATRYDLMSDPDLGPLARSLIQLWYLGQWVPMPQPWVKRNGLRDEDTARILSAKSYQEGLVWEAMKSHPMGAKPQGFGAWAQEPPAPRAGSKTGGQGA